MFTILWKMPNGSEELYVAPAVAKLPKQPEPSDQFACGGNAHVAFQRVDGYGMTHTVIDSGEVYVMNGGGQTVATYRF
jgi:hypothetical protein